MTKQDKWIQLVLSGVEPERARVDAGYLNDVPGHAKHILQLCELLMAEQADDRHRLCMYYPAQVQRKQQEIEALKDLARAAQIIRSLNTTSEG